MQSAPDGGRLHFFLIIISTNLHMYINVIAFNYHMHMYLYVYIYNAIALNAIDITRCCVRTYGD